jgi:hypothetical protein
MGEKQGAKSEFSQKLATKWFSHVPKWLRYVVIFGGLVLFGYFAGKGIWY